MPLYHYLGLDRKGKKKTGFIDASTKKEAKDKLRSQGVMVSSLSTTIKTSSLQNLKGESLMTFTIQLSQLLNAQIPLYESLVAIEEQCRQEPYHRILLSLAEQVKGGSPLSKAMENYPESFDPLYRSMIQVGESVGALHSILEKLSDLLAKQAKLKKQVSTALIYPGILALFSLAVIAMLLGFVVPSIEGIFEGRALNGFTEFVLKISYLARHFWWLYLPVLVGLFLFFFFWARSKEGKLHLQKIGMKLPLISPIMTQAALARFCRTLSTLQKGGLPLIDSLKIAKEVMQNSVLEEEIKKAQVKIIEGSSLGRELSKAKGIPPMVAKMLKVGEEAGSLVPMLTKIAEIYEEDLEKNLDRLTALVQPIILIVMGVIIGVVLMAILLPLTDISSLTGE